MQMRQVLATLFTQTSPVQSSIASTLDAVDEAHSAAVSKLNSAMDKLSSNNNKLVVKEPAFQK